MHLRTARRVGIAGLAVLAFTAAPASAHHAASSRIADDGVIDSGKEIHRHDSIQHGGDQGHLPPSQENVRLVGKLTSLADGPGRIADVAAKGNYAYLNAFREPTCGTGGTHVVDISDPTAPKAVSFIPSHTDTYQGEGAQVVTLDTAAFKGDLLVLNNEMCNNQGVGGISLIDVTNPRRPKKLVEGFGDFTVKGKSQRHANEIHSAFAWQDGTRAYAVMVDDEEETDVDILDITNPSKPVLISETDLTAATQQSGVHGDSVFFHDMVVKKIDGRQTMLASYWDGGYALLDVNNPAKPVLLGDTEFTMPDPVRLLYGQTITPEGNGHQAEFTRDNSSFVSTDEDFGPYRITATMGDGTAFTALQGDDVPQIDAARSLTGPTRFAGLACPGDALPAPGSADEIAVIERGICSFTEKAQTAEQAGYAGAVIFNRTGADGCETLVNMAVSAGIPAVFVSRSDGFRILNALPAGYSCSTDGTGTAVPVAPGAAGQSVDIRAVFDGWGYVHLYDAASLQEKATYAVPESQLPQYAEGYGDLSVHEVATDPDRNDLAYLSYYGAGFRVLSVGSDSLTEVGHYISEGGNNFWGVEVHKHPNGQKYILASDRDSGLWIFQYTGD